MADAVLVEDGRAGPSAEKPIRRYNAEGLAGLRDRPKGRPPRRLSEGKEATLAAVILRSPDPERNGVCA